MAKKRNSPDWRTGEGYATPEKLSNPLHAIPEILRRTNPPQQQRIIATMPAPHTLIQSREVCVSLGPGEVLLRVQLGETISTQLDDAKPLLDQLQGLAGIKPKRRKSTAWPDGNTLLRLLKIADARGEKVPVPYSKIGTTLFPNHKDGERQAKTDWKTFKRLAKRTPALSYVRYQGDKIIT